MNALIATVLLLLSAGEEPGTPRLDPPAQVALMEALAPGLVQVEYTLRYDQGEAPEASGYTARCPACGEYHGVSGLDTVVSEKRPLVTGGFLIGPASVLTTDIGAHPRFMERTAVRFRDRVVNVTSIAYALEQNAAILELADPLADARVLEFDAKAPPPYLAVTYQYTGGFWTTSVQEAFQTVSVCEDGRRFVAVPSACLMVSRSGIPVGASMNGEVPTDDTWKGSPLHWPVLSSRDAAEYRSRIESIADRAILRASLSFRSPRSDGSSDMGFRFRFSGDGEEGGDATERNVLALLWNEKNVLVLAHLSQGVTARLERIRIHPPAGEPVAAVFRRTLRDFGGFVAELESPLPGAKVASNERIEGLRNRFLASADIRLRGEQRVAYYGHDRIVSLEPRWEGRRYPDVAGEGADFLFDSRGALVAVPILRRPGVTEAEDWSEDSPVLTPVAYLEEAVNDPARGDPSSVPLAEDQEDRLAWIGVELQALDPELARVNRVSSLTQDGATGAVVSFVYLNSPAASAGVEPGYILLRLHVEGEPRPLEVKVEDADEGSGAMLREALDDLPEELLDQMPSPWPSVANSFTRRLTQLGFGRKYKAEFFHDGKTVLKDLEVTQGPPSFETAPHFKSEPLGLTVRDLTYEVRRYFRKEEADPGVIVSKVERGCKAAVAGIRPMEIITHVNDTAVANVATFRKLIEGKGELRLSVTRMTEQRLVKITLPAPVEKAGDNTPASMPP